MGNPNRRLISILGLGWLAFLGAGLGLKQVLSGPAVTVVIDRSYCDPTAWQQQIVTPYANLYDQNQQNRLSIDRVIYFSDLGMETATELPTPDDISRLSTYGRFNPDQLQQAKTTYPEATVLSCGRAGP